MDVFPVGWRRSGGLEDVEEATEFWCGVQGEGGAVGLPRGEDDGPVGVRDCAHSFYSEMETHIRTRSADLFFVDVHLQESSQPLKVALGFDVADDCHERLGVDQLFERYVMELQLAGD